MKEGSSEFAPGQNAERSEGNIKIIETPDATYKIAYGEHFYTSQGADLLNNADGLVPEMTFTESVDWGNEETPRNIVETLRQSYPELIARAESENTPIFLCDVDHMTSKLMLKSFLENNEPNLGIALLFALGIAGAYKLATKESGGSPPKKTSLSRRSFLKASAAAAVGTGLWLETSAFRKAPRAISILTGQGNLDESGKARTIEKFLVDIDQELHPETQEMIVNFRNILYGRKLKSVAKLLDWEKKRKPVISAVMGAAHFGIEKYLQFDDKEIEEALKRSMSSAFFDQEARDKMSNVIELRKQGDSWSVRVMKDQLFEEYERDEPSPGKP